MCFQTSLRSFAPHHRDAYVTRRGATLSNTTLSMKRRAHAQHYRSSVSTHDSPEPDVVPLLAVRKTMRCNAEAVLLIQKVVVVKLMHPFSGVLRGHSAASMQRCGERGVPGPNRAASKGAKSACATSLVTSGQASARAAMKTTDHALTRSPHLQLPAASMAVASPWQPEVGHTLPARGRPSGESTAHAWSVTRMHRMRAPAGKESRLSVAASQALTWAPKCLSKTTPAAHSRA